MKSWLQERDLFLAQTMAFVEEIAASRPTPVKPHMIAEPTRPVRSADQPIPVEPERVVDPPAEPIAAPKPLPAIDERAEITRRVASFKAHQLRLIQDRDRFFRSVMMKIDDQRGTLST
jgi:hypothetical protein